jgi:tetratricopeptide (TPR) repeat protein
MTPLMHQRYDQARRYLDGVLQNNPQNIDALYMQLNVNATELLDYESYPIHGDRYLHFADSILAVVETASQKATGATNLRYLFYKANVFGFIGLVQAKQEEWVPGIKNARISVKLLKSVLEKNPDLTEATLGVGMYNYYIGQNLRWLPFMNSRARDGIADVEKAATAQSPFSYGAQYNLLWILIDCGDYARADSIVSTILTHYPDNTIFVGVKAHIAHLRNEHAQAITVAQKLVSLSQNRVPVNWCDIVSGYKIIIAGLYKQGHYKECVNKIETVLSLDIPASSKKISYIGKHLNYIYKIHQKIKSKSH